MTKIEDAYQDFLLKVQKNGTNDGISTDRGHFAIIYNEVSIQKIESALQDRGVDDIRDIQKFLVLNMNIPYFEKLQSLCNFKLPQNYLDFASVRGFADSGDCKNQPIRLEEVQSENLEEVLDDDNNKPSFFWRETLYTINSDNLSVYTDDTFTVKNILLNYYRYPNKISLINPNDPESIFDESIGIEWDDKVLNRILSMCAANSDINSNNPRYQVQTVRAQK
jgi:hypothetical protein